MRLLTELWLVLPSQTQRFFHRRKELKLPPESCVVFEDSAAGIEAAKAISCFAVGVSSPENLPNADVYINNFSEFDMSIFA